MARDTRWLGTRGLARPERDFSFDGAAPIVGEAYNAATGELFYDADGNGAGAAQLFATLQTGLSLSASDFFVI